MNKIETFFEEYSFASGVSLIFITILIIFLRNNNKKLFKKEDDHDVGTGEMNASYWTVVIILIMIGIYLIFKAFD